MSYREYVYRIFGDVCFSVDHKSISYNVGNERQWEVNCPLICLPFEQTDLVNKQPVITRSIDYVHVRTHEATIGVRGSVYSIT